MVKFYFKPVFRRKPILKAKPLRLKGRRETIVFRIVVAILIFSIITVVTDMKMRPIIKTVGGNALKNSLSNVLDGAINDIVDDLGIKYSNMVSIQKNDEGKIVAITLNATYINAYKTEIADKCSDRLSQFNEAIVSVPIGSLFDIAIFNGKGFMVESNATIYGFAVTDVISEFQSAGINQTRHIIYLEVKASAHAYMGLCYLNETVDETIILVETIIVGEVPESYYIRS